MSSCSPKPAAASSREIWVQVASTWPLLTAGRATEKLPPSLLLLLVGSGLPALLVCGSCTAAELLGPRADTGRCCCCSAAGLASRSAT